MGKHLQRQDSCVDGNRPGCMWKLMHILDNNHWHNVKKILPHRKRTAGRRARCKNGSRKATLNNGEIGKMQEFEVAEAAPLLVKQHSTETSSAKKSSGQSRVKGSNAKAKPKEENSKRWVLSFPVQSWLWRTSVVHDVEPSENCLDKTRDSGSTSPRKLQDSSHLKTPKELVARNEKRTTCDSLNAVNHARNKQAAKKRALHQLNKDISSNQFNDHVDILEIFKANKDFFLKILQDPDVNANQFAGLQNSNNKVRFTKSRSFPLADSSRARNIRPSTLKHKQNEDWSFPKREKLLAGTQAPKIVTSESEEDYSLKSMPYMAGNSSAGNVMKQETLGLPGGFSHQGWNQLVINRFKDITQKLMHALQEKKKENIDAIFTKDRFGCDTKELSETPEITMVDGLDDNNGKRRLHPVRRTSSLDESLTRYTQLFEYSYRSEVKLYHAGSLKLKSEEKFPSTGNAQNSTRRNLSLPDFDSFWSISNGAPKDAFRLGMPVKNVVDHHTNEENDCHIGPKSVSFLVDTDKSERLDAILKTQVHNNVEERTDNSADIVDTVDLHEYDVEPEKGERRTHQEQDTGILMNPEHELAESIESYILVPCTSDYITSHAKFSISEGSELNAKSPHVNDSDNLPESFNTTNTEIEDKSYNHTPRLVVDKVDDTDSHFNYVRNVLELSGFIGDEYDGTWYSQDQPLDPSLFKEFESCFQHESESYQEQVTASHLERQALFDLVNETLLEDYERSYTYFPRALSLSGSIRPMPKRHHLLDDVWTRVSSYLSLRPELDQTLDDVVARDLAKGDRWMNLQWETECVALELEDLIFDELLDELNCI